MSQWMTSTSARARAVPDPGLTLPAEVSLAEYAASTVDAPQPAWRTLNIVRERAFTGELRFATAPAITVFVDGGSVYFAERHGDAPLGQRLLAAGVVTPQQLERGVVRVGGAEHLGRLFDRDPAVDRDAVMVVVESSTEALVAELAAEVVAAVEVNPYRHHQSGVHRWFVAPIDVSLSRPVSDVAQVDRSVIDDLPGLAAPTAGVRIEWDQPDVGGLAPPTPSQAPSASAPSVDPLARIGDPPLDTIREIPVDATRNATTLDDDAPDDDAPDETEAWLDDFQIVWPDGSEELAAPAPRRVTPVTPTAPVDTVDTVDEPAVAAVESVRIEPIATEPIESIAAEPDAPTRASTDAPTDAPTDANVSFAMPLLRIDAPPAPGADVPDDVADAVRRALQAIEQAATQPRPLPQIDLAPITLPELRLPTLGESAEADPAQPMADTATQPIASTPSTLSPESGTASPSSETQPTQPAETARRVESTVAAPITGSFAPPTADMSAESVYERLAAEATAAAVVREPAPEPGQASVVFLDEEDADASTRQGALRRLIGSLRRGD